MTEKNILLSFDFEEFDVPREHGVDIPMDESMKVSRQGAWRLLDCLDRHGVKATFFCTVNFASQAPDIMKRITEGGHEVASHGCDHWQPKESDVRKSKEILEQLTRQEVIGYRQPRMFPISDTVLKEAGFTYNSSLNPAFIPGRYMHLSEPRMPFCANGLVQMPSSVTPLIRFPLFWLSLHHLPLWLYVAFVKRVLSHDGLVITYFHPWEFADDTAKPQYKLPFVIRRHCGQDMLQRLDHVIDSLLSEGARFVTFSEYITQHKIN